MSRQRGLETARDLVHLYILRHAIAVSRGTPGYPNDDRPLTEEGIRRMTRAARGIARVVPRIDVLFTSPLVRAHHTARIAARAMGCEEKIQVSQALLPDRPEGELVAELRKLTAASRVMLVGHEPNLGNFAASLVGAKDAVIELKKGALCHVHVAAMPPARAGLLCWLLAPRHLRALAYGDGGK